VASVDDRKLRVSAEDIQTKQGVTYEADYVIGADGANSTLRRQLEPDLPRSIPGYMIWRGVLPCSAMTEEERATFADKTTLYPNSYSYVIAYSIPGKNGSLKEGERYFNLAWYSWYKSQEERDAILTDIDGQ
jgi:2-polyprenyl-6-methoxyphenol hydroxylase-like FAD-dependent oxidoreductase